MYTGMTFQMPQRARWHQQPHIRGRDGIHSAAEIAQPLLRQEPRTVFRSRFENDRDTCAVLQFTYSDTALFGELRRSASTSAIVFVGELLDERSELGAIISGCSCVHGQACKQDYSQHQQQPSVLADCCLAISHFVFPKSNHFVENGWFTSAGRACPIPFGHTAAQRCCRR